MGNEFSKKIGSSISMRSEESDGDLNQKSGMNKIVDTVIKKYWSRIKSNENELNEEVKGNDTIKCPICFVEFSLEQLVEAHQHYEECCLSQVVDNNVTKHHLDPEVRVVNGLEEFRRKLEEIKIGWDEAYVKFFIYRPELLNDSFCQLSQLNNRHLRSEWQVVFEEEISLDAGGITKEWLNLVSKELITSDSLKLFKLTNTEDKRYRIAGNSQPEYYKILGRVIGKAILSDIPLNCPLSFVILKQILNEPISKEDIKYIDLYLYKGMKIMESMPIENIFFETFSIKEKDKTIFLLQDGEDVNVTDENKDLYIDLRAEYELNSSTVDSMKALKSGIFDVIPEGFFKGIGFKELDLIICGSLVIDVKDWKRFTEYKGKYDVDDKVIHWFWEILESFNQEKLEILLYFVTGCYRVPVEGFEHLKTHRGESAWFTIESMEYYKGVLPRAHTCFNRMDLPVYPTKKDLSDALEYIMSCENPGFYLE